MLSKKAKYGLQALLTLARHHGHGPMLIAELAEQGRIPKKFLELILLQLKNAGILGSRKGKGGGYFLAKEPADVTVGRVVRLLEGPLAPIPCVSETAYQACEECEDEASCGIRLVMKDVRDAIAEILDHTSFEDVVVRASAVERGVPVVDYQI